MDLAEAQRYERDFLAEGAEQQSPILDVQQTPDDRINDDLSKYLYPTLIILPLVISAILVLASKAQLAIKIIVMFLLILSVFAFNMRMKNVDLTSFLRQ